MNADAVGEPASETADPGSHPWTPAALSELRADRDRRVLALAGAVIVGLFAASVHWLGLFVAGALVGLASATLPRAVAAGLAVGVLALVLHVTGSPVMGPGEFLALAPASYVTVGASLVGPAWGSLVRGVI